MMVENLSFVLHGVFLVYKFESMQDPFRYCTYQEQKATQEFEALLEAKWEEFTCLPETKHLHI